MKKISSLLGLALLVMITTMGAKQNMNDNMVMMNLSNCAYSDTYTLNLATGGPTPELCTAGRVNQFDIGTDSLESITIYGTTIPVGDSVSVNRGPAGGELFIIAPNHSILPLEADTVTYYVSSN